MEGGYYANSGIAKNNPMPKPTAAQEITMPDSELILQSLQETRDDFMSVTESIFASVAALKKDETSGIACPDSDSYLTKGLYKLYGENNGIIPAIANKVVGIREVLPLLREIQQRLATIVG